MKKLIMASLFLFAAQFSQATSLQNTVVLKLDNVTVDDKSEDKYYVSTVINFSTQEMTVKILNDICKPLSLNAPSCKAAPILVESFTAPYSARPDGCGSIEYKAVIDYRPVDGLRHEAVLLDHSKRICDDVRLGNFEITISETFPRGGVQVTKAHGSPQVYMSANNDEAIYKALNVKEVALNPGIVGASHLQKSVGGLVCTKSTVIYPNAQPTYSCALNR